MTSKRSATGTLLTASRFVASKHVPLIVFLIAGYVLFIQGIFGWLLYFEKGDPYLVAGTFRYIEFVPIRVLAPYVIAGLCIWGLIKKQAWGWWLTLLATAYEMAIYSQHVGSYLNFSVIGFVGLFKFAWLLALVATLFVSRQRDAQPNDHEGAKARSLR